MRKPYFDHTINGGTGDVNGIYTEFSKGSQTKPSKQQPKKQSDDNLQHKIDSLTEELLALSHSYAELKEKQFIKRVWMFVAGLLVGGVIQLLIGYMI